MGKLVIDLFEVYVFLFALSLARSSAATGVQEEQVGDLMFVQKWSTAIQLPERRAWPYTYINANGGDVVDWELCGKSFTSNLGGLGPDTGAAQELRYYNVTTDDEGGPIDLVITNTSEYIPKTSSNNGLSGCFCQINVRSGANAVDLDINMYKTGTYEPVIFSSHFVTIFDVDESRNSRGKESITVYDGVEQIFQYPDHELEIDETVRNGLMTFTSTEVGTGTDNPSDPLTLTTLQMRRSVAFSYVNKFGFKLTFGATGGRGGRNFLFAGRSQLADPTFGQPTPPPTPPTPYPTPPPTPGPTPSPTDVSGGHGDPHMVNVNGERFNLWRLGAVELLRIPRNSHNHPQIRFTANVSSEHGAQADSRCSARYMTSMRFSGSWFGNQEVYIRLVAGEMHVHVGKRSLSQLEKVQIEKNLIVSRPSESLVTVLAGDATINVMHDDAVFKPHFYLNADVRNLGSLGLKIGGVLGLDDHTAVAQKPASCEQFIAVRHNDYGSRASASLHD
jgi:hypothetical protein